MKEGREGGREREGEGGKDTRESRHQEGEWV